mgnify:CR=1 FL=1
MNRVLALMATLSVAAFAVADPIIFDNGAPGATSTGYSSQLDAVYPFQSQVADDFVLQAGANVITDVHWWGVWWNPGPPGNATAFRIIIYGDAGGKPTGGNPDPTPTALKVWTIPAAAAGETPSGSFFSYAADVSADPFIATPGVQYWIAIQSVNTFPPQWGWVTNSAGAGNAHQGFPLLGTPYWTRLAPGTGGVGMAFYLTGIPEPASLLLIGLGALVLRRR